MTVARSVDVGVAVAVGVDVGVLVEVGVPVEVGVKVDDGVQVGVLVDVLVGVDVDVPVDVGDGSGGRVSSAIPVPQFDGLFGDGAYSAATQTLVGSRESWAAPE